MAWNYRIVRKEINEEVVYGIHEVYYNSKLPEYKEDPDSCISAITEEACAPFGESLDELRADCERFSKAVELPILDFDRSFVPCGD